MSESSTSSANPLKRKWDENEILSSVPTFKSETIKDILKSQFTDSKTKINENSVSLVSELMKLMAVDTVLRAGQLAKQEYKTSITVDHVETVLPQMILDYP